jgi:hypothetical protein
MNPDINEQKVFTRKEVMDMLRKHYDNHKKKHRLGTASYSYVMRFYEPLQDDFMRAYLGKPEIKFNEDGSQVRG